MLSGGRLPTQAARGARRESAYEAGLSIDVEDTVASGDRVCVIGRGSGTVNGADVSYGFVHAWTLRDGQAVAFAEYADPAPQLYG